MKKCINYLDEKCSKDKMDNALYQFADEFPPVKVYKNEISLDDYFHGFTEGIPNRQIILEEMLMLRIANENPAFFPYSESQIKARAIQTISVLPLAMYSSFRSGS